MTTPLEATIPRPAGDGHIPASEDETLLRIRDLRVAFAGRDETVHAVNGVDLDVRPGEVFAVVGESGSGKSVSMLSVMGLLESPPAQISGSIEFNGVELTQLPRRRMKAIRGADIGMVFQDPMSSLNPVHPVGKQIAESLRLHRDVNRKTARMTALDLLERVGISDAARRANDFPHEFSGGMRQRAMIAMALACDPKLLIADEPTTALDVTVQRQIVDLIHELQAESGMAVVWITHDLGVVAEIADRVAVMYAGRIMEQGSAADIYASSRHPYTSGLLRSIPRLDTPLVDRLPEIPGAPPHVTAQLAVCPFHDRCPLSETGCTSGLPELEPSGVGTETACIHHATLGEPGSVWPIAPASLSAAVEVDLRRLVEIRDLKVHFKLRRGLPGRRRAAVRAVDGLDLDIYAGRTVGVVGESGSGKSTLGRTLVGLEAPTSGSILVEGEPLDSTRGHHRRQIQMVFQDPYSSMNPGQKVSEIISEPLRIHKVGTADEQRDKVAELLGLVGLRPGVIDRYPHEFSGGQRQRIAIARALAADPDVIVCDEPVSALDVSVQAQIVNLLRDIQKETGLALVFIAHDLSVVRQISHETAVMYLGQIVERASRNDLFANPLHPYTRALLAAVPIPDPEGKASRMSPPLEGDLPNPADPPAGCRFHTRCPMSVEGLCDVNVPEFKEVAPGRWASCHLITPATATRPVELSLQPMSRSELNEEEEDDR